MRKSIFTREEIEADRRRTIGERNRSIGRRYTPPTDEDDLADQIEYIREHLED